MDLFVSSWIAGSDFASKRYRTAATIFQLEIFFVGEGGERKIRARGHPTTGAFNRTLQVSRIFSLSSFSGLTKMYHTFIHPNYHEMTGLWLAQAWHHDDLQNLSDTNIVVLFFNRNYFFIS
jgi:hypothetical protein